RQDLVEQNEKEIEILGEYLPPQLSESEIREIIRETIEKVGAAGMKDMGKVMGAVMPQVKGRAEGGTVNRLVKEMLQ
ncbi:MAG TPA: GatB/YqeY domain-containing protein, partial [Bacillota bacterium]|nr:GatB/YqeY domain-containing protein [Bacillota bacterium]